MSDYWDAVVRVARGQPGSAEPRPRAMFEAETLFDPGGDIDPVERDASAIAEAMPAAEVVSRPAPTSTAPAMIVAAPAEPTEAAPRPKVPAAPSTETADARPAAQPRAADPSADTGERTAPPPPRREVTTRVEVHRVETHQTTRIVESRPLETHPDDTASSAAAAPPAALAQQPERGANISEPAPVANEPPALVVAEPVVGPAPDRLTHTPEPPLVIEIGRIDIRILSETPPPPAAPKRRDVQPVQSLDEFLRRRGTGP